MPKALLDKMLAARTFDAGFATVEFAASALVDMAYHAPPDAPEDPLAFEAETLTELDMPEAIAMRHRTPHFLHVFSGDGYSAGYYSYMWSEVLDADAFSAFEETGDAFDPALAEKLQATHLRRRRLEGPRRAVLAFRGKMPTPEAMMEKRGLVDGSIMRQFRVGKQFGSTRRRELLGGAGRMRSRRQPAGACGTTMTCSGSEWPRISTLRISKARGRSPTSRPRPRR